MESNDAFHDKTIITKMKKTYHQCFGASNTQNILITPSDFTQEGEFMITIQFCDFVAVWFGAKKEGNDLLGNMQQLGAGTIEENTSEVTKVCEFLDQLGYKKAANRLRKYVIPKL
jgi:hypothetical protein